MDWFYSIVRIAGASFPVASSLVQLQAEIDSKKLLEKVARLEDPISNLHEDIPNVSRQIYKEIKDSNSSKLYFNDDFYRQFSRALAVLESKSYIKGSHALGKSYAAGINLIDPTYIMYLCAIEEDSSKMESLIKIVDDCEIGQWLDGNKIEIDLPLPVIKAVFEIYESKGFGLCSKTINYCQYIGKA